MTRRDEERHQAGGPGKSAKKGHIDPENRNKPGQKQTPHERGPGGEGGTRGVPPEDRRDSG